MDNFASIKTGKSNTPNAQLNATTLAQELTAKALTDFKKTILPWLKDPTGSAPKLAYCVTVGTGKTQSIIRVTEEAARCRKREAIRMPTLKLCEETQERIEAVLPNSSAVWRGREQPDPRDPSQQMCLRVPDVKAAQSVGGAPTDVCGSKKRGYCPFHPNSNGSVKCGYLQQKFGDKPVIIFAGDAMLELTPRDGMKRSKTDAWSSLGHLHQPEPTEEGALGRRDDDFSDFTPTSKSSDLAARDFDLLILDETEPVAMLSGFDLSGYCFSTDALDRLASMIPGPDDQEIIVSFVHELITAAQLKGADELIPPLKIGEYYFDITDLADWNEACEAQNWHHKDDVSSYETTPGVQLSERNVHDFLDVLQTVREIALKNVPKPKSVADFHKLSASAILDANSKTAALRALLLNISWICEVMTIGLENGASFPRHLRSVDGSGTIAIRRKKPINTHYAQTPTMIFDATLREDLLQCTFEGLDVRYRSSAADGQGVTRYQLSDKDLSYATLRGETWNARLMLFALHCRRMHGRTGLICPKFICEAVSEQAPPDVELGHFGALKGMNSFEKVNALIVASRTAAHPYQVEDLAGVLTGRDILGLPKGTTWYPRTNGVLRWRQNQGAGWLTNHVQHPDPIAEQIRASITEDGLEQALGRGRNVRRSTSNPLVEYIMTSTPTNRPIDGCFTMAEFRAVTSWIGVLLEWGIWFESGSKGLGGLLYNLLRSKKAEKPNDQLICLFGDPAFESPKAAADWRKKQIQDNLEIALFTRDLDVALSKGRTALDVLHSSYPLDNFKLIEAKVLGTKYFSRVHVRTKPGQSADDALRQTIGILAKNVVSRA